ncbi:DUF692 family multinuclear iron-containing protein [Pseudomonas chlororaphis]|uniref:Dehydrogenase n=1 Tax=Pseudomonas chlororaphis TaxID=587753 RepID=A0A1Q8EUR9_9PSED|nr:DUF692 family multinuclear iron-containing protein [Pseudomonas chlororaphis]OLF55522.1 dehydrogenase [Pseudomonas chlororaphis]
MDRFDSSRFAQAGVGLEYHLPRRSAEGDPTLERILGEGLPFFDYLEFQPTHCILQPGLLELSGHTPVLLHSSSLSLGSVGIEMDPEFLRMTRRLCDKTGSPWLAEHISWSRFHGGDTQHFILPTLAEEVADTVVANALALRDYTGTPLVLENAPRLLALDDNRGGAEGAFISSIVQRSEAGFLLDLDSAIATARTLGYDLHDYLGSLPLDRLIEVHIADPLRDWEMLRQLFACSPLKAVTLEWDIGNPDDDEALARLVGAIKALRPQTLFWQGCPAPDEPAAPVTAGTPLTLRDSVWLSFAAESFRVRDRQLGIDQAFAADNLGLLQHFLRPQSLDSALLLPGVLEEEGRLAFLQQLLELGVLVPGDARTQAEGPGQSPWTHWDAALDFYLGTRTAADTPYVSVLDLEQQLTDKTVQRRQPSAFKDYFSHPFFALDNPLLASAGLMERPALLDTLIQRSTSRAFEARPLSAQQLSVLLYYTWGATVMEQNRMGDFFLHKTSPAGGSLHVTEVYPLLMNVQGLDNGLYHYSVRRHGLELLSREDPRQWINEACGGQPWIDQAAVVFLSTARLERMAWKYEFSRALRVALMDSGHLSQSFSLVATALGLKCCTTAALRDETFETRLGLDYLQEPVFLLNGAGY